MPRRNSRSGLAAALLALAACSPEAAPAKADAEAEGMRQPLGLMTSLPLYWPEGAEITDLAAGRAPPPWQRVAMEQRYTLTLLDTLSSQPGLSPDAPETDPLTGLDRLAVIQPRGLSPADNVALDEWVRAGGRLLLVLDPALTGEYDLALGDPRRPVDNALIPPVVALWGLAVSFDEAQEAAVVGAMMGKTRLPLALAGKVAITDPGAAACRLAAKDAVALCKVGEGQVTLIADAAVFEHPELAGEGGADLRAVLAAAFE
ncbi:hypothetical protein [Porphyrobacter sp. AAP60]|uniref:hypothetical protein n=1 Tax=Porphyrobacter sp. AAP60 TaxID=1523423 RepID=UPI0006B91526|nr:hypothetical protein [Porphyrobacter sp. AAP60]KPF61932.1 hypothetical protein IP79_13710 [Porphyrobacter sp. AAP60]